jgi:hypothetical protein
MTTTFDPLGRPYETKANRTGQRPPAEPAPSTPATWCFYEAFGLPRSCLDTWTRHLPLILQAVAQDVSLFRENRVIRRRVITV